MGPEAARALIDGIDESNRFEMWGKFQDRYDPYTVHDLAETVAGLHYEYAVQVVECGQTLYIDSHQVLTRLPRGAMWVPTFEIADNLRRKCATELCLQGRLVDTFLVRRLTSELEVIDQEANE